MWPSGAVAIRLFRRRLNRRHPLSPLRGQIGACAEGHEVRLIPAHYVKPYVKRGKNDVADAEAICEAA
ncbi:MAG: hypothetical protein RL230_1811, partial [Pseudomonadota bacterium]